MKDYFNVEKKDWARLCQRPAEDITSLLPKMQAVFEKVRVGGDAAIREYTELYDKVDVESPKVSEVMLKTRAEEVPEAIKQAIDTAFSTITAFHKKQLNSGIAKVSTAKGVTCWQEKRPIDAVGLYVPGGSAPLVSTVLMLAIPAKLAGCQQIILATPPDSSGNIPAPICYAALKTGVTEVFAMGGAQAVAAMSIGTESIPRVSKIAGPGNQYVTAAKCWAFMNGTAIDMVAGPSEVMVVADSTANPDFVAADLLSQAEHGPDSQVVLVSDNTSVIARVKRSLAKQLAQLPRKEIASHALKRSFSLRVGNIEEAIEFANTYAPEHLILAVAEPTRYATLVRSAGSVFLGNYSPESAGDYASGTNHTLPTNGWARSMSGLSVECFQKSVSFQSLTKSGLKLLAPAIEILAKTEGLEAHRRAVSIRLR